jgi:phosphoribosylamine--glycine ligase
MKVLVVGGGGREHALCWTIAASPLCHKLFCAPGNAGIAEEAECVPIAAEDIAGLLAFVQKEAIDYVVVGPEAPLVAGVVDRLAEIGVKAFGPSARAAQLEGSKGFTKDICAKYDIPTAAYARFTEAEAAKAYVREHGAPIVVKADGLAAGKGVTVAMTEDEALAAIDEAMAGGAFGAAGAELVIEAVLEGEEASFFALVDGDTALPLVTAQDHKRVFDGDEGPNTGGMGAYSPAPVMTPELIEQTMVRIVKPTVAAMKAEGMPYKGVLFAGLMITDNGPELIEYNVRFGDPECQVILMRLMSDLLPALIASTDGVLSSFDLRWYEEAALTVVMAAKGYPGAYDKGTAIRNLERAPGNSDDVKIFHAGTKPGPDGAVLANGGRVLNVTAMAPTIKQAQELAYAAVDKIDWPEGFCRRDIGWRAIARG